LGALTGNQAIADGQGRAESHYLSGWQVAADANNAGEMVPRSKPLPGGQRAGRRAADQQRVAPRDQINHSEDNHATTGCCRSWQTPRRFRRCAECVRADESHDRRWRRRRALGRPVCSAKKFGHMGGKVLVPGASRSKTGGGASLPPTIENVPSIIVARTDATALSC